MRGEGKKRGQAKYRKRHIVHRHPSAPQPLTALSQASQDSIDVTAVLIVVAMAMAMAMVVFVVVVPRIDKTCGDVQ